jgi:hypothetical protein
MVVKGHYLLIRGKMYTKECGSVTHSKIIAGRFGS